MFLMSFVFQCLFYRTHFRSYLFLYLIHLFIVCVGCVRHTCGSQRTMCECRLPFHHVGCGSNLSCCARWQTPLWTVAFSQSYFRTEKIAYVICNLLSYDTAINNYVVIYFILTFLQVSCHLK